MAFNRQINTQILNSLGMEGEAGEGRGDDFLRRNPQLIESYAAARRRYEPEYDPTPLTNTIAPGLPITDVMAANVRNPTLPSGTEFVPTTQTVQQNELIQGPTDLSPTGAAITSTPKIANVAIPQAAQAATPTVDPSQVQQQLESSNAGQLQNVATLGDQPAEQAVAQQMTVSDNATVQGQLNNLLGGLENGETPIWARGAVSKAEAAMASRGLGASSLSSEAITAAIINSALPIASQDAQTYFQAETQNLANRQQTELENLRIRQQNLLTDTSIKNAAEQFNAANELQMEQFTANLVTSIQTQNANRISAIEQFNAAEVNRVNATQAQLDADVNKSNAQLELSVAEFNSNLQNQREQFNSQMQYAIEQSNVQWRRSINTANTAAINAATQTNVQNKFNLSQVAQNNIWQMFRDEASWAFTSAENAAQRDYNAAQAANNRQFNSRNDSSWLESAGKFAASLFL